VSSSRIETLVDEVQAAFAAIGDASLSETQYRHGRGQYGDGRASFAAGMSSYKQRDWVLARGEFETALNRLVTAEETFRRAVRFSESDDMTLSYERAEQIAQEFARAVDLLSDAASAHASGDSSRARRLREDAQTVLSDLRELGAPPDPDDLPVDPDVDGSAGESLPEFDVAGEQASVVAGDSPPAETDAGAGRLTRPGSDEAATESPTRGTEVEDNDLDEAELEALTAEIETQGASEGDDQSNE
jgi:hypothetical protein